MNAKTRMVYVPQHKLAWFTKRFNILTPRGYPLCFGPKGDEARFTHTNTDFKSRLGNGLTSFAATWNRGYSGLMFYFDLAA